MSLVPSLTLALFDLGAGRTLVGRTSFCVEPRSEVEGIPVVGGTKNVHVERVLELEPDVVLANREENTRERVEAVARTVPVWLSDPRAPTDVPSLWRELGTIGASPDEAERRALDAEIALRDAERSASHAGPGFVYWVWRDPWMAAGRDTYISRVLETAGWRNLVPEERGRYPRLTPEEALGLGPAALLFASEPYAFALPDDLDAFGPSAVREGDGWRLAGGGLALGVDGQVFGWYPSFTVAALRRAVDLRQLVEG
ncbi:MAG: helical backbone metal receptor [Deinococcales bacterium]